MRDQQIYGEALFTALKTGTIEAVQTYYGDTVRYIHAHRLRSIYIAAVMLGLIAPWMIEVFFFFFVSVLITFTIIVFMDGDEIGTACV